MNDIQDLQNYIADVHQIYPTGYENNKLIYRGIWFKKNLPSKLTMNNAGEDMWTVQREGHSIDFYRTDELLRDTGVGGGLEYFLRK